MKRIFDPSRQGPTEDENGNRLHSAAGQAVNQTFGGLALGFSGAAPDRIPDEVMNRNPLFQPGISLGPPYIDDLRMTTTCVPVPIPPSRDPRVKNLPGPAKLPQVEAVFYPGPPKGLAKVKKPVEPDRGDSCRAQFPECPGEDPEAYKKMFLIFGQSEEQRPPYCPPVFETSEATVFEYFEQHNIEGLMEYFLTLLCINLPDDPFQYMQDLSEKMIKSRRDKTEGDKMDMIFEPSHLLAMFSLFDKEDKKAVSVEQYKNAMEMLGLPRYNAQPIGYSQNLITEDVFFDETSKALDLFVKSFIG